MCVDPDITPDFDCLVKEQKLMAVRDQATVEDSLHYYRPLTIEEKMLIPHVEAIWWVTVASAFGIGIGVGLAMGIWVPLR